MRLLEKVKDILGKPTPSPEEIAAKYKVPVKRVLTAIEAGAKVEHEHTANSKQAAEIARDHLGELGLGYYEKLAAMETSLKKENK